MMDNPQVFVARKIPAVGLDLLRTVADVRVHSGELPPTREELISAVKGCHGILSLLSERMDSAVFEAAGNQLRVVSNFAVGTNNIEIAEATARGIAVGNTPDVLTDATADIAIALLLAATRRMRQGMLAVAEGTWRTWEPLGWLGLDLTGKTIGIVGMGRIGETVARRLYGGWQMKVLYTARSPKAELEQQIAAQYSSLQDLLRNSDFVSLHVPLTKETTHLIGEEQLSWMKPEAILINTARGEVVDQAALINALHRGKIFSAGLDVCVPEPLPLDSPLLQLDNCIILPHIGSATIASRNAMAERAAQNIVAGLQGRPLPFPVN